MIFKMKNAYTACYNETAICNNCDKRIGVIYDMENKEFVAIDTTPQCYKVNGDWVNTNFEFSLKHVCGKENDNLYFKLFKQKYKLE